MTSIHSLTQLALLTALSLALYGLESQLPLPFLAPGAKLGLANIITCVALILLPRQRDALFVLLARILLASCFGGGPVVLLYSLAGGLLSFAAMSLLCGQKRGRFSLPAISAAGGFFHHLGQLLCASALAASPGLLSYLSVLGPLGLATGLATGLAARAILQRLPLRLIEHPAQ